MIIVADDFGLYAVVEVAWSRWLPWPGRTSRWWYEIHRAVKDESNGIVYVETWAYQEGGSGGGFTLSSALRKARKQLGRFATQIGGVDLENDQGRVLEALNVGDECLAKLNLDGFLDPPFKG